MKAILEFDLPEEDTEFKMHLNGPCFQTVLQELDNWLRAKYKYEDQDQISIEEVREKIYGLCEEHD